MIRVFFEVVRDNLMEQVVCRALGHSPGTPDTVCRRCWHYERGDY